MNKQETIERSIGLAGATGVGIGAIVGGGILALAGVAYATTGPATLAVFAANGVIAVLTALSFAEMSTAFPESGGTYTFAKNVLSVRAAFAFGWVGWFASIVAGVLYALGFASYAAIALQECVRLLFGIAPEWLVGHAMVATLAICATAYYAFGLIRTSGGGDNWINIAKMIVFAVLIGGGLWALTGRSLTAIHTSLTPFLTHGTAGFFKAMGYTFIALQGFGLIAAVAGEVRAPERTLPRAMLLSLAAALGVYLPLLFVIATVGVPPGQTIGALSAKHPEVVVALAARHFLGETGFWLVLVAAILSMLSALQVNLLAASRVALTMAQDRTLPAPIGEVHIRYKTPITAICVSALTMAILLMVVPDVAAAGAAASLIFLISFAMTHWTSILARTRRRTPAPFHTPFFPLIPVTGGLCCAGLALFQAVSVPTAGLISAVWLGLGGLLYWALLARRARVVDASAEALDPQLLQMRGRSPLVLVPVANPQNASAMVAVAHALAPQGVGRVLLLSVVAAPEEGVAGGRSTPFLTRYTDSAQRSRNSLVCFWNGTRSTDDHRTTTLARDCAGFSRASLREFVIGFERCQQRPSGRTHQFCGVRCGRFARATGLALKEHTSRTGTHARAWCPRQISRPSAGQFVPHGQPRSHIFASITRACHRLSV